MHGHVHIDLTGQPSRTAAAALADPFAIAALARTRAQGHAVTDGDEDIVAFVGTNPGYGAMKRVHGFTTELQRRAFDRRTEIIGAERAEADADATGFAIQKRVVALASVRDRTVHGRDHRQRLGG